MLLMSGLMNFQKIWMHLLADVNSGSGLHPLLDSLQRYVPLVSKPFIQVLGHFLCLQVVPKKLSTESSGQCWNTRFLDYFGPSRLSWGGWTTLAKKWDLPTLPTKFCCNFFWDNMYFVVVFGFI